MQAGWDALYRSDIIGVQILVHQYFSGVDYRKVARLMPSQVGFDSRLRNLFLLARAETLKSVVAQQWLVRRTQHWRTLVYMGK